MTVNLSPDRQLELDQAELDLIITAHYAFHRTNKAKNINCTNGDGIFFFFFFFLLLVEAATDVHVRAYTLCHFRGLHYKYTQTFRQIYGER